MERGRTKTRKLLIVDKGRRYYYSVSIATGKKHRISKATAKKVYGMW